MDTGQERGQKRKASSELQRRDPAERRKITRACDSCKEKKTRCTGTLPCQRCIKFGRSCEYTALYTRGTPPSPLPGPGLPPQPSPVRRSLLAEGPGSGRTSQASSSGSIDHRSSRSVVVLSPKSNSPEPEATDLEGNYLGPSSGISFLTRVCRRLRQDDVSTRPVRANVQTSVNTPVFLFGDRPFSAESNLSDLKLPPRESIPKLLENYFDYSNVTYRFLHRPWVVSLIDTVYEKNITPSNPPPSNWAGKAGVVYMVFAVSILYEERRNGNDRIHPDNESERWYAAARQMMSIETGPPSLETIQVRLGLCLFLLSSSRANQCWYMFGTTVQLVTALGLHRRSISKAGRGGPAYVEQELRKRIFWSVYTLDKYLSMMFGRPRLLDYEDIDQDFPDEVNDDEMQLEPPLEHSESRDCMMIASVLHYKLSVIMGEISRRVYPTRTVSSVAPFEAAIELVEELQQWKRSVHPMFSSVRASSLIPPLCRQSHVLHLAYSHAMIHATRPFLLSDFTDLSRRPLVPHSLVATHVRNCIDAARDALRRIDVVSGRGSMLTSFWFFHYVCFCAIIVVYIYTIQQHRSAEGSSPGSTRSDPDEVYELFRLGEKCQMHLAKATQENCPSRRYSIILEELRVEVHRQLEGSTAQLPSDAVRRAQHELRQPPRVAVGKHTNGSIDNYQTVPSASNSYSDSLGMSNLGPAEPIGDDLSFLDSMDGSAWWTQLDAWAYSSISNEASTINF